MGQHEGSNTSNSKLLFYVFIALLAVWSFFMLAPQLLPDQGGRFILDPADLRNYYNKGNWLLSGQAPVSEFPQIPTYLFGLNRLFSVMFRPDLQLLMYFGLLSLELITVLFFTIRVLIELLPDENQHRSLLMFLPTSLYFALNRFDILPTFLTLLAFYTLIKNRSVLSLVILAVATFTKWYPVLLLPGFLLYLNAREHKFPWKSLIAFVGTSLIIIAPTFLLGGMNALIAPYQFHTQRGMEYFSFPVLVSTVITTFAPTFNPTFIYPLFFGLQIFAPFVSPFIRFDRIEDVLDYSIVAIALFILFSRIDSPQWFLWLMPFLILTIRGKKDIWLIIFYNLVTYLTFPLAFDLFGETSTEFKLINTLVYIALFWILFRSVKRVRFSLDFFRKPRPATMIEDTL